MVSRKTFVLVLVAVCFWGGVCAAGSADEAIRKELEALKQKVAELEARLEQARGDAAESEAAKADDGEPPGQEGGEERSEEIKPRLAEIKEDIEEKMGTLEFHGGAVAFYQGAGVDRVEGERIHDVAGAGIVADLTLSYKPALPVFKNGSFFMRVHAGQGKGADKDLEDKLFANLNAIADDSESSDDDDGVVRLLEAYYAHEFLDGKLILAFGKTDPLVFIDNNAFANCSYTQFVGKAFVNNPVINSEDEYSPLVSLTATPFEPLSFTVLAASTSGANGDDEDQKSVYDNVFDHPLVAGQMTYTHTFGELEGNYRVYVWSAGYDHCTLLDDQGDDGRGVGLSFDQQVTDRIGLFARASYHSEDAYDVRWFWSGGTSIKGLLPSRAEDVLGLGIAGLKADAGGEDHDGTELHLEAYYRVSITEYFAVSPHLQFVANPLGNEENDHIVAGMLRSEFMF